MVDTQLFYLQIMPSVSQNVLLSERMFGIIRGRGRNRGGLYVGLGTYMVRVRDRGCLSALSAIGYKLVVCNPAA